MSAGEPPALGSPAPDEPKALDPATEQLGCLVRIVRFPLIRIVAGIVVCGTAAFVGLRGFSRALVGSAGLAVGLAKPLAALLATGFLLACYQALYRRLERRPVDELAGRRALFEVGAGFGLGVLLIGVVFAVLAALGCYRIESLADASGLLPGLALLTFYASVEEVLFRGVLYRIIEESLGTGIALAVSAALFGLVHINNPNGRALSALSAGEAGVLLGLAFTLSGRLWLPIGLHTAWNYMQTVLGTPVSGVNDLAGDALVHGTLRGPVWLTGGAYGSENSMVSIVIVLIACVVCLRLGLRTGRLVRPFWRRVPAAADPGETGAPPPLSAAPL
jgi:uncharacterized protein